MTLQRNSSGNFAFQASMKANLTGFGLQRRLPPFLTLPCPREASGLLSEAVRSLSQRPRAGLTSDRRADAFGPTCSALTAQPLNLMPLVAMADRWSLRCVQHHDETRPCISLPFIVSFKANIARKRPEPKRDGTRPQRRRFGRAGRRGTYGASHQPRHLFGGFDKAFKQGVRGEGFGFQFGVELHADEPRVVGPFHDLGEPSVGRHA